MLVNLRNVDFSLFFIFPDVNLILVSLTNLEKDYLCLKTKFSER